MDDQKELKWWEVKDSGGNRLRQPPEWDRLDEEMVRKAGVPDDGQTVTVEVAGIEGVHESVRPR